MQRRFEQLPRERQDEILRIAASEFARSGFRATSYNQLLERLKLGKSSAYYYFDDKRDLFLTVLKHCYASFFESLAAVERPKSARGYWQFVHHATVLACEFVLRDPIAGKLMACMHREQALLGELASMEFLSGVAGYYDELIAEGQRLGAIRTDMPAALLGASVRGLSITFDQWFIAEHDERTQAAQIERAAGLFLDLARRLCEPR